MLKKIMKYLLTVFTILISLCVSGQNNNLLRISLEFSQSIAINSDIEIEISNTNTDKEDADINMKVTKYSKEERKFVTENFIIKREEYNEICNLTLNIKPVEILNDHRWVLDGETIILKLISDTCQHIEYYTHGFNFNEKTTTSKEFLYAVKAILKYAKVEIYGINKFKESVKR